MPRVMLLGRLPLAGQYQPPPGRLLQAGPGLYGLRRGGMGGLGATMEEICNDPGTMFAQALAAGFSGAASSGCTTRDGAPQDAGWCAASTGTAAANTALNAACTQARASASASGDPTALEDLRAQLEIERLRNESTMSLVQGMQQRPVAAPAVDYKPYIIGGLALVGIIGLVVVLKKR